MTLGRCSRKNRVSKGRLDLRKAIARGRCDLAAVSNRTAMLAAEAQRWAQIRAAPAKASRHGRKVDLAVPIAGRTPG